MSVTAERPAEQIEQIERLVDSGYEAAVSVLTLIHAWTKVVATAPFGYSPAVEAANLLARARQQNGQRSEQS